LAQKGERFILVEKRQKDPNDEDFDPAIPYYYAALLDDCASLYPDIKVNVSFYRATPRGRAPPPAKTECPLPVLGLSD